MNKNNFDTEKNYLLIEQVRQLYRNLPASNLAVLSIGLFLIWILWSVIPSPLLIAWYSYILIVAVARMILAYQYKQFGEEKGSSRFWLMSYMVGVVATGLGWGITLIYLVPEGQVLYLITIVFLVCGLVTGSVASLSSVKYGFIAFSLPSLLPGIIYLAFLNSPYSSYISFSILLFFIFITFIALGVHKTILYSINKQLESAGLLIKAEEEKKILEEKCNRLEEELKNSNKKILKLKQNFKEEIVSHVSTLNQKQKHYDGNIFSLLFDTFDGGVWDWNVKTGEITFSDNWLKMLAYKENETERHSDFWKSILHPDEKLDVLNKLNLFANGKNLSYSSVHRMRTKSGSWIWVISHALVVAWDSYGAALNIIGMEINVSDSDESLAHMLYMSTISNQRLIAGAEKLKKQLHRVLETAQKNNSEQMICYLRIDELKLPFKNNKSFEDVLSKQFIKILLNKYRQRDTITSLGNYNYLILLEHCSLTAAWDKAKQIQNILKDYKFSLDKIDYSICINIGITPITSSYADIEAVMEDVKLACDLAGNKQPDCIYIFQRDNEELIHGFVENEIISQIKSALNDRQFQIVSTPLKTISAALSYSVDKFFNLKLKITEGKYSLLSKENITMFAERNALIVDVDKYFIAKVHEWLIKQPKQYNDSRNVYFMSLHDATIIDKNNIKLIKKIFEKNAWALNQLCFVISDELAVSNYEAVDDFIKQLKPLGCSFALEDIGIKSLSEEYIRNLDIDYIKIDSRLISDVDINASSLSTVKYINEVSHLMNLKTIAENVNNELVFKKLQDSGVDFIDGKVILEHPTLLM